MLFIPVYSHLLHSKVRGMAVTHGRGSLVKLVDTIPERPDSVHNFLIEIYLIDNIM